MVGGGGWRRRTHRAGGVGDSRECCFRGWKARGCAAISSRPGGGRASRRFKNGLGWFDCARGSAGGRRRRGEGLCRIAQRRERLFRRSERHSRTATQTASSRRSTACWREALLLRACPLARCIVVAFAFVGRHPPGRRVHLRGARAHAECLRARRAAAVFLAQWGRDEATSGSVRSSRRTMTFDRNFVVSRIAPRGSPAHGGAGAR